MHVLEQLEPFVRYNNLEWLKGSPLRFVSITPQLPFDLFEQNNLMGFLLANSDFQLEEIYQTLLCETEGSKGIILCAPKILLCYFVVL